VDSLGFELSVGSYDDWLEAALSGHMGNPFHSHCLHGCRCGQHRCTGHPAAFITDGYRAGDIVRTTLYSPPAATTAPSELTAVTASDLTLDATVVTLTNDTGGTITYPGRRLDIGTVLRTFTVERQFLDIVQYQVFKGVSVGQLTLNIKPEAMIGGTFTLVGMDGTSIMTGTPLDAAPTTPSTNAPCDAFKGSIYEGGTIIAVCTGLDLTLNNNRSVSAVVGSQISPEVFEGQAIVTGNVMVYFKNLTTFNKWVQETESSIWTKLADPNGTDFINVVLPRVKYTGSPLNPPSDGPIVLPMTYQALEHTTYGTTMWIQRSN
jgi:hypothetical protein